MFGKEIARVGGCGERERLLPLGEILGIVVNIITREDAGILEYELLHIQPFHGLGWYQLVYAFFECC